MSDDTPAGRTAAGDSPIFEQLLDRGLIDPVELPQAEPALPPDAAARDAAKREEAGRGDGVLHDDDFRFITRGTTDEERAAVIAVLAAVRAEETQRVRRVERREHQPWSRSQRVPEGIGDLLVEG